MIIPVLSSWEQTSGLLLAEPQTITHIFHTRKSRSITQDSVENQDKIHTHWSLSLHFIPKVKWRKERLHKVERNYKISKGKPKYSWLTKHPPNLFYQQELSLGLILCQLNNTTMHLDHGCLPDFHSTPGE